MNPSIAILASKEKELSGALAATLRERAFDNRYSLHPRQLDELGADFCHSYIHFLETADKEAMIDLGSRCARAGLGDKTMPALLSCLQSFIIEAIGGEIRFVTTVDEFATPIFEGFITERENQILKDQEQLRRALSTALESQSRELLIKNYAISTSINGIMLTDLDGRVTWVNASFLSLWGYAALAEVSGRGIEEFWTETDAQRIRETMRGTGGWRGELEARRKDGTTFSVEMAAGTIRNEEDEAIGIMTSFVDITEKKRLLSQVIQSQKMEALGQLAGGITHDFNNLLTAISGYLQFLLLDTPPDTRMHQDLMQIRAAVDRGTGLTRQLRLFTRQTAGNRQVVSLNEVARETWEILKRTFPPVITIELGLDPTLWTIEADANQMSQVLVNLCVNARDAMTDANNTSGGGALGIATANVELAADRVGRYMTARAGRYVSVSVRDSGSGIPPEIMERLFVPFVTTKSARSGTGLGLAVVYGIVASHHGFIDVHSVTGAGTVFEILFPMAGPSREPACAEDDSAPPLSRGQGSILIVDDELQIREIMSRVLASCGYTVVTAVDGAEALARFGTGAGTDLVVLDMMMPGMNGVECLAALREVDPGVRVLVTTGYTSNGSVQDMLGSGSVGVVEKPVDLKVFTDMVKKCISLPRAQG
jgi:two-component system, cell cycle sensor histidine kinase and response regulator CckA